jgi:cytochrome c553
MMGNGMMGSSAMASMMSSTTMAIAPRLQGQNAAYLVDQLNRYAQGARPGSVMQQIAAGLLPADRKAVAAFLAGQP